MPKRLKNKKRKYTKNSSCGDTINQDSQELEFSDGNPKLKIGTSELLIK